MRRGLIVILAILLALFTFSENEVYKKDIRNRLVIQGIGIDLEAALLHHPQDLLAGLTADIGQIVKDS